MNEAVEAEIVEDEFQAPILKSAKKLAVLVNTEDLIKEYSELANTDIETPVEELAEKFLQIEQGFKKFRNARTSLEKARKEIGNPAYEFHKKVKSIADEVQKVINPYELKLKALKDKVENEEKRKQREIEEAEEQRIDNAKAIINRYKTLPMECIGKSAKVIGEVLNLASHPITEQLEEFYDEAVLVYDASINQIQQMYDNQVLVENAQELQAAKDEELRVAKEIEEKKLQDEKDKFEAEKAKLQKERDDFRREMAQEEEKKAIEKASKIADELLEKQQLEQAEKRKNDKINLENAKAETHNKLIEFDGENEFNYDEFIEAVINKEVPNLEFVIRGAK